MNAGSEDPAYDLKTASERSERATQTERAGEAARERACRRVRRGEAPRTKETPTASA
jgi:hypothetical protein